ncbi:uncharacterized protein LOC132933613 [Metopolophium dirhodum]|uniref:uncharacterized protein LOC132933613 n=1 Tax=Metopolophium dirhodum TaxID=44670 RepID=UPI0029904198|nr:uncharacterized protein LOC132933613 [Metopolophium dirhodum]
MSNEGWSARNDALTEFSYGTNENQYTGIYLNHEYLNDISIMVSPNNPERNGETINDNTGVVHTLSQLNQPQQNSATTPRPLIHTDDSNETPLSLNVECDEPVVKSYYRNNTSPRPINMNNVVNIPNIRNKRPSNYGYQNRYNNQPYLPTSLQHLMPVEQIESGPFSPYRIVNASPSTSTSFRPSDRHQYTHNNNNSIRVQEYPSSPYRCESVIKYCQPIENKFETFNASKRDPRLINRDSNTYRLDNFEELTPLSYTNKETYLDEDLRVINIKLKNMNSSYRFGVVNDLRSADNFNIHNIRSGRDPRVKHTQNDRESETYIDCNKHLNILNTERYKKLNVGKMIGVIDVRSDNEDVVNDIETTSTSNVVEQYHKKKKETLRKSREDDQKELTETVENIILNLNDDISDLRCTTRTLSKKNDGINKTNDLNDQTKNNIKKANQNILTVENSSVDNTHKNVDDIFGSIGTYQNYKQLSERSIELVDLTYEENTADVRTNQNVDAGMFTTKLKDMLLMSTFNKEKLEKFNKSSENSEKLNTNKNETNAENIILNEDRSIVDQRKTSEKKSHKHKSKKRNKSKDNNKHSEMYKDGNSSKTDSGVITIDSAFKNTNSEQAINSGQTCDEQTNNAGMWTKLFKQEKKNELISKPNLMVQRGNQTPNINKKFMKNACDIIENIQNEIFNLVESINSETYVGVQPNPNTSTESAISVTDVGEKTYYAHDQISIRVQDPYETTESNFPNINHRSSINLKKIVTGGRGTNENSLKSNTVQSLPNPEQDEFGKDVEEQIIECPSENMSNRNSTIHYAASDFNCESNEASFENVDDEQNCSYYTEYQSTGTNETDIIYESHEDASQSQTVDCMFDNSPSVDRGYNSALDLEKEVPPYIKLSDQILNENSISCDGNDFNYNMSLIKLEHFEVSNYEEKFAIDMEGTDTYETGYRTETLEDDTQSPRYTFIDDEQPDVHNVEFGVDNEEPVDPFLDCIVEENSETRDANESNIEVLNTELNVPSVENEDTEVYEIIDNVWSADEPPTDVQPVGEHFEMDYFYNIIKINHSLFRVNLHTEDDIFNFIQLYSQRTQTSWRVLKSFKSQKYDVCKIFGCLHNGLFKLLKKPDKKIKPDKCECQSEIDIKIKCSTIRGKNSDPYLKNGLPAIVRFKNDHNHLVPKVTELPLLKSITDNNIQITLDKGFEPAKIRRAYNIGINPNSSPPVIDITNLSDDDVEIVEITDIDTSDQITENNLFGKWEDANIQCDTVETKNNKRLEPGQQVVNNGERANDDGTSHQLVDTSYRKDYSRTLKGIISDRVKAKWLSDKMTTEADQVSLYKCSGKKCSAVFSRRKTFVPHLNDHCRKAKSQKKTLQFMICMYCFKSFDMINIDALANHIFDNYSFCKYFCQYCLYRAYTASHVLVHEYIIHGEKKPSILQLKDRDDKSKEIVKVVDFNKFVLRYVCNIGNCAFYSYMNSDFLYHLSHDHVECGQFYCNICDKHDGNGFEAFNPISFVKHFSVHNINTYQCIFCLFGTELLNHMIIHLAMEHFEYEPLCLERSPINIFCDDKKIENLIILNIKKSIPAGIIKVVNAKSLKDLNKKKCQTDPADTICTNVKSVNIDNTTQVSKRSIKEVIRPSKNTLKLAIDNKNNTIISDGAKRNVPRDEQQIPNVEASIVNEKKKSSQLSIYEIMNNSELKKKFGKPFKEKGLKTPSFDDRIDRSKKHANKRLDNTCKKNEIRQTSSRNTSANTKTVDIENTTQILRRSTRNVHPSKNTIKPEIDNKNNTVISDEAKRNVPKDDEKRFPNSGASIEKEKKKLSQLAIHDIRKNNISKPEIDNKNNTVISDKAKRNVPRDNSKRIPNSEASIENDKNKSSQLAIHDIRKNNTTKLEIDNKNNTVISDEAKRNVPRDDVERIPNSGASIENEKNKSSQLAIHDIKKNIKSKKTIRKPVKEKSLEITSSDGSIEQCKLISKKSSDKVIPAGISYQDHLKKCPTESPTECTFCLAQVESTFDVVKFPRLPVLNCFTCTFCNLKLPSSDTAKSHVKEVHNISNVEFVPVDINATNIEKDRFLVCEDKCLKRQKRANDSSFYTEICKTVENMKRSKVVSKDDDLQLTTIGNTTNISKQQVERNPDESLQQHKTTKRKYSNESTNNVAAVDYKKTPCWKRLYDNIPGVTISMYFSPRNIDNIPLTPYFLNPVGCLLCNYHTKVRSNLVSHLNRHGVEPVVLNKHILSKSVINKLKPAATVSEPGQTVENSIDESTINTIKPQSLQLVNHIPKFVPKQKRFRCALPKCFHFSENFGNLQQHITKDHSKFSYFVCPHCRPLIVTFDSFHALAYHYNFHGSNLYICQYCDYIHYDCSKIESHQTRKHPFRMSGENNLNVIAIRKSNYPDMETSKWQCNICEPGIKYTESQIAAHLSIVHKIKKMFRCPICQFDHSNYDVFEQHFALHHPSLDVKNLDAHFEKISPDVELEPADKQTNVDKQGRTRESPSLNVPEAFDGATEPRAALPSPRKTPIKLTSVRKTSAKSFNIPEDQGKTLDNPSSELNDYSKLKCSTAKYECPVCNEFAVEEKESFREHLLKEINSTLWKCLECFTISNSAMKMKTHVIKHNRLKRKFEKIEITKKSTLVDGIIDYQNMLMEHKLLKKNNQHTVKNGAKHGNVQ